jgi:hypothetical protein
MGMMLSLWYRRVGADRSRWSRFHLRFQHEPIVDTTVDAARGAAHKESKSIEDLRERGGAGDVRAVAAFEFDWFDA